MIITVKLYKKCNSTVQGFSIVKADRNDKSVFILIM